LRRFEQIALDYIDADRPAVADHLGNGAWLDRFRLSGHAHAKTVSRSRSSPGRAKGLRAALDMTNVKEKLRPAARLQGA
jgi:hypothetical protein